MRTTIDKCEAKDPSSCHFHGLEQVRISAKDHAHYSEEEVYASSVRAAETYGRSAFSDKNYNRDMNLDKQSIIKDGMALVAAQKLADGINFAKAPALHQFAKTGKADLYQVQQEAKELLEFHEQNRQRVLGEGQGAYDTNDVIKTRTMRSALMALDNWAGSTYEQRKDENKVTRFGKRLFSSLNTEVPASKPANRGSYVTWSDREIRNGAVSTDMLYTELKNEAIRGNNMDRFFELSAAADGKLGLSAEDNRHAGDLYESRGIQEGWISAHNGLKEESDALPFGYLGNQKYLRHSDI
jgi:hypothetical protein